MRNLLAAAAACFVLPLGAHAASVTVNLTPGTLFTTDAIGGFATTGGDMDGMLVTGTFAGGASETLTFNGTGGTAGSTGAGSFSVALNGNSFTSSWSVNVSSGLLTSLQLQGAPGDTIFDVATSLAGGSTENSENGRTFEETSNLSGAIVATYSNNVALTGDAPVGDLYESLFIDLSGLAGGGLSSTQTLAFRADTDNAAAGSSVVPAIPLPASFPLILAGLGALGLTRKRRKA
ncbi:VPLPA-CTERM sorting domain-containing protein [Dinoroseobacter sp. S375]|uniref:VPLPA-CTERM sorting domain-containing protein n=1 Tax=Dinoroseobacter sp. S375 TaxID=3415136 RepID=UPI003C79CEB2